MAFSQTHISGSIRKNQEIMEYSEVQSKSSVTTYNVVYLGVEIGSHPLFFGKIRKNVENSATHPDKTLTICNYNNYLD